MKQIIYVSVLGGPPFDYVLPRLTCFGDVTVMQPERVSARQLHQIEASAREVVVHDGPEPFIDALVALARRLEADALVTFDEFYLPDVAAASVRLGLRGPGPNVLRSVRKDHMYKVLDRHGLLGRPYIATTSDCELAASPIPVPYVVKPAQCAGSLGVFRIASEAAHQALPHRLAEARSAVERVCSAMTGREDPRRQPLIREGLLVGDAAGWFGTSGEFADYISLEGIVIRGIYHPVAITQNMPMIPDFTETAGMTPTTLPLARQIAIAQRIKPCIEDLGLDDCGVHTEIKLLAHGEIAVIETAARFSGWGIIPQVEQVLGVDLVSLHMTSLLTDAPQAPPTLSEIWERRHGGAATVALLAASDTGVPWRRPVAYNGLPGLSKILCTDTRYALTSYVEPGDLIPPYSSLHGAWSQFGRLSLNARSQEAVESDVRAVRRRLHDLLLAGDAPQALAA